MSGEIVEYYQAYEEARRLSHAHSLERIRSQEIISRYLPAQPCRIVDIGGAAGVYSFWLASFGHAVSLVDLTPKHIEQARLVDEGSPHKLESLRIGNALELDFAEKSFDHALLMGPLYHLSERPQRVRALAEAARVVKAGGLVFVAVISRFASMLDGFKYGLVRDPAFRKILAEDIATGRHRNDTDKAVYFTTAYLHRPEELESEIADAGLGLEALLAVEGVGNCVPRVEEKLEDESYRAHMLATIRATERDAAIMGMSSHFLAIARRRD